MAGDTQADETPLGGGANAGSRTWAAYPTVQRCPAPPPKKGTRNPVGLAPKELSPNLNPSIPESKVGRLGIELPS